VAVRASDEHGLALGLGRGDRDRVARRDPAAGQDARPTRPARAGLVGRVGDGVPANRSARHDAVDAGGLRLLQAVASNAVQPDDEHVLAPRVEARARAPQHEQQAEQAGEPGTEDPFLVRSPKNAMFFCWGWRW